MFRRSQPVVPVDDNRASAPKRSIFASAELAATGRSRGLDQVGGHHGIIQPLHDGREPARSSSLASTTRQMKQWVEINLNSENPWKECGSCHSPAGTADSVDSDNAGGEYAVNRVWCCYPMWASRKALGWDSSMEPKFDRLRYVNFEAAFMHASFLMAVGVWGLAAVALSQKYYQRTFILAFVVAPMYGGYGLFVLRRRPKYLSMSGTVREKILVGLLSLQILCIVYADWVRPDFDYGLLVIHIGVMHNFAPLGADVMQIVTIVCGLIPYLVMKVIRFNHPEWSAMLTDSSPDAAAAGVVAEEEPAATAGLEGLLVQGAVPIVIFIYQVVVTLKRDESLRCDLLSRLNLVMQQRTLDAEKNCNEGLLMSMLPRKVINDLKQEQPVEPQHFEDVTVIFVEICDFDHLCANLLPADIVEVLNIIYLEFDRLSDLLQVYKVETVGQVYMAVVGCPEPILNHADVAAHFALAAQQSMRSINGRIVWKLDATSATSTPKATKSIDPSEEAAEAASNGGDSSSADESVPPPTTNSARSKATKSKSSDINVVIHIGLHSGPIRAGIVGIEAPRYKLFGDTVNTASRMESTCGPGRIQASSSTLERLTKGMFRLQDRGEIPIKGKGHMRTAYLNSYADSGSENSRRVLIEHGQGLPMVPVTKTDSFASSEYAGLSERLSGDRLPETIPGSLSIPENKSVMSQPSQDGSAKEFSIRNVFNGFCAKKVNNNSNLALVSVALGRVKANPGSPDDQIQGELSGKAAMYAEEPPNAASSTLSPLDRLQLFFLLVPSEKKQPHFLALLRRNLPAYQRATHEQRLRHAKNLTMLWLLFLALLGALDFCLDTMEKDVKTYRTTILFRIVCNSMAGLAYLLVLLCTKVSTNLAQCMTVAMLAVQGLALLACDFMLYNSQPATIALFGGYILFYTVCTVLQRLLLCCAAVIFYVVAQYAVYGMMGLRLGAANVAFLVVFIAAMACSVRLQEHLQHSSHWEQVHIERWLEEITITKAAGSELLRRLLPAHVVPLLGENLTAPLASIAEHHSDVTCLFTDIKGFTAFSSRISAKELVHFLNSMYSAFDEIIAYWALYKVEIIGDAYFVSAGCPAPPEGTENDPVENAMRAVEVGLALLRTLPTVVDDITVQMRVGLHTGSVVAGVVGKKGPRYHLFGSTVAYAEKMESTGIPGKVQISDETHALLRSGDHAFDFEERYISIGGDGLKRTWLINSGNSRAAFQIQKKLMSQRCHNQQISERPTPEALSIGRRTPSEPSFGRKTTPSDPSFGGGIKPSTAGARVLS